MNISSDFLKSSHEKFVKERSNLIAQRATVNNGLLAACAERAQTPATYHTFNVQLKDTIVRDQKHAGVCWLFSGASILEYKLMQNYKLKDFELSKNYLIFYDKLEKSNYFINEIIENIEEPLHSRLMDLLLEEPTEDGGDWDLFKNIVNKYGVVPEYSMPESENSSNTEPLDLYLAKMLRSYARDLRNDYKKHKDLNRLEKMHASYLDDIYRALAVSLGTPPTTIDFEARDSDDKLICFNNLTPKQFFTEHIKFNFDDYVELINAPAEDKPFNRVYQVDHFNNVKEGSPTTCLNVPIDIIREAVSKQLKDNDPVWFAGDVEKHSSRYSGKCMDVASFPVFDLWNVKLDFNKGDRLTYNESYGTHAMVFVGLNEDEKTKQVNRYKVENSWGKDVGDQGFFTMSADWFDKYVYVATINKKHLDEATLALLKTEPIHLEPWNLPCLSNIH